MNYKTLGEQMANAAKEMLKLNAKLDSVLEKLVETESLSELKESVKALLDADQWDEAKLKVIEGSKISEKHIKLVAEEESLRLSLDSIRQQMIDLSQNGASDTADTATDESETPVLNVVNG
jgi:hypothetical protein